MIDKILKIANVAALVILAIAALVGGAKNFGAGNGSTSHTLSQFDAAGGFAVNGTVIADASGNVNGNVSTTSMTVGGLNAITKFSCATASGYTPGTFQPNTSTTKEIALTGANSSGSQAYFGGFSTSTKTVVLQVTASGTNNVAVTLLNTATSSVTLNQGNLTACFVQ